MNIRPAKLHVAVVGGGVFGCAVAYQLARDGFRVTLVERDAVAAHASGHNAGNLNPLYGTPPSLIPFALESFHIHQQVQSELKEAACLRSAVLPVTRIFLGYEEKDRLHLDEVFTLFNASPGFSAVWLERDDLRRLEPRLAPDVSFGLMTNGSLTLDSHEFTHSLAEATSRLGAEILHDRVLGVVTIGDRITQISTSQGHIVCDAAVFTTGPWVAGINSWLGLNLAIEPVKGEILLMRLPGEVPRCDFTYGMSSLYRRRENEVWIGGTLERCGFDASPSEAVKVSLLDGAARIMPCVRDAELLDHVAALRPMPVAGAPIAGRADGWHNVYVANGGGMKGMLWSVGIAKRISGIIRDDNRGPSQLTPSRSTEESL